MTANRFATLIIKSCPIISLVITLSVVSAAQTVLDHSKVEIVLSDSTLVTLFKSASNSSAYYYLPTNFRLATNNKEPQFSFLTYDRNKDNKTDGAIIHILLTWGLTEEQRVEAGSLLIENTDSTAIIYGTLNVEPAEIDSWKIYSKSDSDLSILLNEGIQSYSNIPTFSNGKWAASFGYEGDIAQRIKELLEDPYSLQQVLVAFNYKYRIRSQNGGIRKNEIIPLKLETNLYDLIGKKL